MGIVTVEDLARAFVLRMGMNDEDAAAHAEHVLDIFGFEGEIIDNLLDPVDRQLFYSMESHGLVTARSDETTLNNGQDWRTHSWAIRADRLAAGARGVPVAERPGADVPFDSVYRDLPSTAWSRR
ncbi:MAG TPA: DUF6015 family protein [Candidatus Thermoplasmatota archaeon]|nr:DUF6015 family protein [Candidatus Thermoplasmatota archaeon]